jgi:hypothetical protein
MRMSNCNFESEAFMVSTNAGKRIEHGSIEIELFNPGSAWIRSAGRPVTSPRGSKCAVTKYLEEALAQGIVVKCDTNRPGFFEVDIGDAWFYFHVADKLGHIYLVATLIPFKTPGRNSEGNDVGPSEPSCGGSNSHELLRSQAAGVNAMATTRESDYVR